MAITSDNYTLTRIINENISRLGEGISEIQSEQKTLATCTKQREIRDWLSSPDPSPNHNAACKTHQKNTGNWLLESESFREWETQSKSFLWLHGIPGCGKSVLCSTVIENVKSRYSSDRGVTVAYYYFSFTDSEKQKNDKFVRSLIEQFAWQSAEALKFLEALYSKCENGRPQPTADALESTLKNIVSVSEEAFIIVDALDECTTRDDLLALLETLPPCATNKLHILVTSRKERDIEQVLDLVATKEISLQGPEVENDIQSYITHRLQGSTRLRRWPAKVRGEIEETLTSKAKGMFRWVACQMDVLEKCVTVAHLRKALLAYSLRPLSLRELAEVIAIGTDECNFDPENRLTDPRDLLTICSRLVTTVSVPAVDEYNRISLPGVLEIRLAHFSVKEYLISERIRTRPGFQYDIRSTAEVEITRTCLTYLLYFQEGMLAADALVSFPLAAYAAKSWTRHFELSETSERDELIQLAMLLCESYSFYSFIKLFDPENPNGNPRMQRDINDMASPVYYFTVVGLSEVVSALLERGADVNTLGGFCGNPLQAAARNGHVHLVALLLQHNADINALGGYYSTALNAAAANGHTDIVTLLLDQGANIDAADKFGSALYISSKLGNQEIVSLLLERGADVSIPGLGRSSLYIAAWEGHTEIVSLLLQKGADPNAASENSNPLCRACAMGHKEIVALLLQFGANAHAWSENGSAVYLASRSGERDTVALLLDKGAEVNGLGPDGDALWMAYKWGHKDIISLLRERGAQHDDSSPLDLEKVSEKAYPSFTMLKYS